MMSYRKRKIAECFGIFGVVGIVTFILHANNPIPPSLPTNTLMCAVPAVWNEGSEDLFDAIMETWASRCDRLRFFIDPTDAKIPSRFPVIQLAMVRKLNERVCKDGKPCRHIWEKVWRMWLWVARHDIQHVHWFAKIDTDSYVFVNHFKEYIDEQGMRSDDAHYFGHKLYYQTPHYISGVATFYSREAIRRLAPQLAAMPREYGAREDFQHGRCVDRDGATEERTSSLCLREVGIYAEDTVTDEGQERILLWRPQAHLEKKRLNTSKGWYWRNKPSIKTDKECCSDKPIAFHPYKSPKELRKLHAQVTGKEPVVGTSLEARYLERVRQKNLV